MRLGEVLEDIEAGGGLAVAVLFCGDGGVRPEVEAASLLDTFESFETAGFGEIADPDVLPGRGPAIDSFFRLISRSTLNPHVVWPGLNRSVLNGISTSALHPGP